MITHAWRMFKYIYSPRRVRPQIFYVFMTGTFLLSMILSFMFHGVIIESKSIEEDPILKIQTDAGRFLIRLRNDCAHLFSDFQWLEGFLASMKKSCVPVSATVQTIRIYSYAYAMHNTLMMHVFLHGDLPVTIAALLPGFLSLIGTYTSPKSLVLFVLIQLSQIIIGFAVMSVAFFDIISNTRAD